MAVELPARRQSGASHAGIRADLRRLEVGALGCTTAHPVFGTKRRSRNILEQSNRSAPPTRIPLIMLSSIYILNAVLIVTQRSTEICVCRVRGTYQMTTQVNGIHLGAWHTYDILQAPSVR